MLVPEPRARPRRTSDDGESDIDPRVGGRVVGAEPGGPSRKGHSGVDIRLRRLEVGLINAITIC